MEHRQAARRAPPPRPRRRAVPGPITSTAWARRKLRVERRAQRPGRKHLAVADAAPAIDHQDRTDPCAAPDSGSRRPSRSTSAPAARAASRAGDAVARHDGRRGAREQQRLVADVGGAMAAPDRPAPARRARRHSRGSGRTAVGRPPASICATAIAVGVLPAPPTVRLPTQMTGTPARAPGRAMRQRRDRAVDRGERRQQAGAPARPGATRTPAHASPSSPLQPELHQVGIERRHRALERAGQRRPSPSSRSAATLSRASASLSQAPIRTVSLPASVTCSAPPAASSAV